MEHGFRELDDVALHLSGLMMVRQLRMERGADKDELRMYSDEIDRVRSGLAGMLAGEATANS